jgi:hypothetical protein
MYIMPFLNSGKFREEALGAIAPIPKKICPYSPAENVQKLVDITSNRLQNALFDLNRFILHRSAPTRKNPRSATVLK